jgi:hypothetical protein
MDTEDLEENVSISIQDQFGVFGTPINIGTVNGNPLTMVVERK